MSGSSLLLVVQTLLPEKRMLFQPNLAKASGSTYLPPRIKRLGSSVHCFGHTHFNWDAEIDGVRYVQWPEGYPQEKRCVLPEREHAVGKHVVPATPTSTGTRRLTACTTCSGPRATPRRSGAFCLTESALSTSMLQPHALRLKCREQQRALRAVARGEAVRAPCCADLTRCCVLDCTCSALARQFI